MRKLSLKQKRFVKHYLETGNGREAVYRAKYDVKNDNSASVISSNNLNKENIQEYMRELMDQTGLSDDSLVDNLKTAIHSGLNDRSLKKASVSDSLRALEMAFKLRDRFPAKKIDKRSASISASVNLEGKSEKHLIGYLAELKQQITDFEKMVRRTDEMRQVT